MPSEKALRRARTTHARTTRALARPAITIAATAAIVALTGGAAFAAQTQSDVRATSLRTISEDAQQTLESARDAVADAAATSEDAAASDLDLGGADTSIDTGALRDRIDRLAKLDVLPVFVLTDVVAETKAETTRVTHDTSDVRSLVAGAQAHKAAQEAEARAAAEAAAKAAAEAAALAAANTPDGAKATARQMAADRYGWGDGQFSCLESLWNKESGWNYQAYNGGSGATGIPQSLPGSKMASAGADWQTNATTQISWGLDYIARGYGSPCNAWGHSQATNWY